MDAVTHLAPTVGILAACDVLGVARASFYRQRPVFGPPASRRPNWYWHRKGLPRLGLSARPNAPAC